MKVNFNQAFKNFRGEPILENDGTPQLMKGLVSAVLFGGAWLDKKSNVRPEEKVMAYDLSIRIFKAAEAVDLTVEEAAMIKEAAFSLSAGGYAQIINLIEGK